MGEWVSEWVSEYNNVHVHVYLSNHKTFVHVHDILETAQIPLGSGQSS